jgi:hypothetical protein
VAQLWFRKRFFARPAHGYEGCWDEAAFGYTWRWFELVRAFFRKTAEEGRPSPFPPVCWIALALSRRLRGPARLPLPR